MKKISEGIHVQNLIARHMSLWEAQRHAREQQIVPRHLQHGPTGPYITFSREFGSGGQEISKRVAERLGWQHFDREIVEAIAGAAHTREELVAMFDEKVRNALDTWVHNLFTNQALDNTHYLYHLVRVLNAIAAHGNAVIIGRGAHLVLPPENGLRVRVIAPMAVRIQNYIHDHGGSAEEARREIALRDSAQANFIRHHFHRNLADPFAYDLIINSAHVSLVEAVTIVAKAAEAKLKKTLAA